jgi:hypothetical protein
MKGARAVVPLSDDSLRALPASVSVPSYDRRALRPGVVHMSVGSFHRSHQAVYFDELANGGELDWGIVGLGLGRPRLRAALSPQDGLYTVVARGSSADEARVVGAMSRYLFAPEDREAALEALADERTAMVTLTITAAAYDVDAPESSCALDYLVAALDRRRRAGRAPFTVLSCDNLPANGAVARAAVVARASRGDARLAGWIDENVAFPDSMVDRITPRSSLADRERLAREHGVLDSWPVVTEPFSQWIVEDRFCNRRPPLDEVGVQFVDDVKPYALMKTRLLNASHCAIGVLGSLLGLQRADEVMRDAVLRTYVERLMTAEVVPLLPRGVHAYAGRAAVESQDRRQPRPALPGGVVEGGRARPSVDRGGAGRRARPSPAHAGGGRLVPVPAGSRRARPPVGAGRSACRRPAERRGGGGFRPAPAAGGLRALRRSVSGRRAREGARRGPEGARPPRRQGHAGRRARRAQRCRLTSSADCSDHRQAAGHGNARSRDVMASSDASST